MAVKVHVWPKNGNNVGHASLQVGSDYISYWPDEGVGKKDVKKKASQAPAYMTHYLDDVRAESNKHAITVILNGLDEEAILDYWTKIRSDGIRYQLKNHNCSHVVAACLYEGSKAKPTFKPSAAHYGRLGKVLGQGVWTPDQVLLYAHELRRKRR